MHRGQANHFAKYAPENIPYAIQRYQKEVARLYTVLDTRLQDREWLVGNQISLADIKTYPVGLTKSECIC